MTVVLETSRLSLREMTIADLDFIASLLDHPEVMRFYPKRYTREEARGWVERQLDRYAKDGIGFWLVIEKATGEPVGQVGLLRRELDGATETEIGYLIHRPFWRRGFASEAAIGCRDHAFEVLELERVISLIRPINLPSQGVARKMGMTLERKTTHADLEHFVFARVRPR
jgi:ribosomal-protein-alanine N-acetyltransferase